MRINRKLAAAVVGVALLPTATWLPTGMISTAEAGTKDESLSVKATVNANCNYQGTTGALDFSTYDPLALSADTTSTFFKIKCTKATVAHITMNNGSNYGLASGYTTKRAMKLDTSNFIAYDIFQPNALGAGGTVTTTAWIGSAEMTYTSPGSSTQQQINVFGEAPAEQDVAAGSYTDTVTITASY